MLPHLTKFDAALPAGSAALNVPPPRFRPLRGPTHSVSIRHTPYRCAEGLTSSQRAGLRYEHQVQEFLRLLCPHYWAGPYIHFTDDSVARTCQPDGLLIEPYGVFIFEMKYQHMPEAWWQLEKLYRPLVELCYPDRPVSCVEVCRSFDPATPFPCSVELFDNMSSWISKPRKSFGVFRWRR